MLRRIVVALAVAGLLAAGLVLALKKHDREERALRGAARLTGFDDRRVTGLTLATPETTWRIERREKAWRVVAPVEDAADPKAVEALIAAARRSRVLQTIDAPESLASYGLDPPAAILKLEGVEVPPLSIGRMAPTGEALFAQAEGRTGVLLLAVADAAPLAAEPASLRDRALVDLARSEVATIEVEPAGIRLVRTGEGWWMEKPNRHPAATSQVDKILAAIYGAKVAGFDDAGAASDPRYGLGPEAIRVVLRSASDARTLLLGADAGGGRRFVAAEGRKPILLAQPAPLAAGAIDAESLREPRLTNVNRYAVTRVEYGNGAARFAASRKDDTSWQTDAGAAIPADRVLALLVRVLEAPTRAWTPGTPAGPPTATLSYATDAKGSGRVAFYGTRATWDALPGVVAELGSPPPAVPAAQ